MTVEAIEVDRLCRDFAGRRALDGLTLRVPAGTVLGLLGPNGAGKTTTIRLLLGLLEPTSGQARVFGLDPRTHGHAIRSCTGALLEHSGLYERLSAADNLEFYGRVWRLPRSERRARIEQLLSALGLWERRSEPVATWSKGMKQKLAIARALLHRPRLLVLDEPTAGLDPVSSAAVHDDLAALVSRDGVTVLLTTHNLGEAEKLCTRIAILRAGQLLAQGAPHEIRARSAQRRVDIAGRRFGADVVAKLEALANVRSVRAEVDGLLSIELGPGAEVAALVGLIVRSGGEVEEVRRGQASLEDAFQTLMKEAG